MTDWADVELIPVNGWIATPSVVLTDDGVVTFVHVMLLGQDDEHTQFNFAMSFDVARKLAIDLADAGEHE